MRRPEAAARAQRRPSACPYNASVRSCARRAITFAKRWRLAMTPSREDLELYVTGNFDGDIDALERAIADNPALAAIVAEEARLEELLRDAATVATFCVGC